MSDLGGPTGWQTIGPGSDVGYQLKPDKVYKLDVSLDTTKGTPTSTPAYPNNLKSKFDNAQTTVAAGSPWVAFSASPGGALASTCFECLPAALPAGSRAAQMAQQEQAPHAVVYADPNKKIANTRSNNDGSRWGDNSKRNVEHHIVHQIPALSKGTGYTVKASGEQNKQRVMECKCMGEWECKNAGCKLAASTGVLGKFHMKKQAGTWRCNGLTGSGCGSEMSQVAECPARRFRVVLAPVQAAATDSVAYVYTGGHADTCQTPAQAMLSGVAIDSVPNNVSPALAVSQACNQLALNSCFGPSSATRVTSLQAIREMHNNPEVAKKVAVDKAGVSRNKTRLRGMQVDQLTRVLFTNMNETIVGYHNEWNCTGAWKGTVLIEGIVKDEVERLVMAARPNWEFNQVHHLLAMCDDDRVLALLHPDLVARMQKLHYHFDSEHPDVVLGLFSHNSCTYDFEARELVSLCRCISATETAVDLVEARKATDSALRRHLSVVAPGTDWSGFCFRPRVGTVLDEGYAGQSAFKAPEASGQASTGCRMHFQIDLERRANRIGGEVGATLKRLAADLFLRASIPEEFGVNYVRLLKWLKAAAMDSQQHRDVAFFVAFWLWPPRCRRVATAFQAFGPKSQLVEILHAQTQALGRKGLGLAQAIFFDIQFCMAQAASRALHFRKGYVRPDARGAGPIAREATLAAQAQERQATSLVYCATHRCDKFALQQQVKAGLIYATKPQKGEMQMQGISCMLSSEGHTTYRIILPEGQLQEVASECVSAADKTYWEMKVNLTGKEAVFATRDQAPRDVNSVRSQRYRTSSEGGQINIRLQGKPSLHAANVLRKAQDRGSVEVLAVQWVQQDKVELLLLFGSTTTCGGQPSTELKQHIVTLGHEPMCSCIGMCATNSPDRTQRGAVTMCSHYVGCLLGLLEVESNDLCRQVALTSAELEPLLLRAECLVVNAGAQERWELDIKSKQAEGSSAGLCCPVLTPCVSASGVSECPAQERVPGEWEHVR